MNPAPGDDLARAQDVASRYGCEFVNLQNFQLQSDLLKKVPARLMFRYNFVPLTEMQDGRIAIAIADPSQLMMIDEISLLVGKRIVVHVASIAQINEILERVDESAAPTADPSPDEPIGPSGPDAPVRAPLKPKPHLRSGAARAVPEREQ
jgi:CheY-like chemotaxis protein